MEKKDVSVYRRFKKLGEGVREMRVSAEEIREFYDYLQGRQTPHGDAEYAPADAPLMVWGVALLKDNGAPWTHGEARKL